MADATLIVRALHLKLPRSLRAPHRRSSLPRKRTSCPPRLGCRYSGFLNKRIPRWFSLLEACSAVRRGVSERLPVRAASYSSGEATLGQIPDLKGVRPERASRARLDESDRRHGVVAPYRTSRADRPSPSRLRRPPGAWRNRPRLGLQRRRYSRGQRVIPMRPSPKSLTRRPINSAAEPHGRTAAGSLDQNDSVARVTLLFLSSTIERRFARPLLAFGNAPAAPPKRLSP